MDSSHYLVKRNQTCSSLRYDIRDKLQLERAIGTWRVLRNDTRECVAYIIRHHKPRRQIADGEWYIFDENDQLMIAHAFETEQNALKWLRGDYQLKANPRLIKRANEALSYFDTRTVR